ncbi:MAG: TonB-dependent receptor, partial [Sphingomicrobium sp.]
MMIKSTLRATTALQAIALLGMGLAATPAFAQSTSTTTPTSPTTSTTVTTGADGTVVTQQTGPAGNQSNQPPAPGQPTAGTAPNAEGNDTIVVTGSILRRTDTETPSPVTVLTATALQDRGVNTVSDAVTKLSNNNAGTVPQGWNNGSNFATGATGVSLRGLTVQSTLVIFDGLRTAPYPLADDGHRNFVDLNTIPDAIVDRIEILRDGASSTYGSDAIAGVVNVITKKEVHGLHLNGSAGLSQRGDGAEYRIDATVGFGDLRDKGYNFYVSGEFQRTDAIHARDRGYPFNTADQSRICNAPGSCAFNGIVNGIEATGDFNGLGATTTPVIRPYGNPGGAQGPYVLANPSLGCQGLTPITLNPYQQTANGFFGSPSYGAQQCQQDLVNQYQDNQPAQKRYGLSARGTVAISDNTEFYAQGNFYEVKTHTQYAGGTFSGLTAGGGTRAGFNPFYLPVYICPIGTPMSNPTTQICTSTTPGAQLNPYNPYAANNQRARLIARYDRARTTDADARTYRFAAGITGSFLGGVNYNVDGSISRVDLTIDQKNFFNVRNLITAANSGLYDFLNPANNTQAQRDFIAPPNRNDSNSQLKMIQGSLSKDLFQLPGGPLQAAVGASYRQESIRNPSANPVNNVDPYDRYQTINAVGAEGKRNVKSAFFEIGAPIVKQFEVNVSGRYDKYSSGQSNFSPKIGAKFTPIRELAFRGTYSRGFRIASFNEAYGLPTTGYITSGGICVNPANAAFCSAHGNNAYATGPYAYGLTATGNPNLKPEKSRSFTFGTVFEPSRHLSFTIDYFNIKINDLITGADYSKVVQQYYANNGVVTVPGIVITPAQPDPNFPTALPLIGTIEYSFQNANSLLSKGVDFGATSRFQIGRVKWTSYLEASYLLKYAKYYDTGAVQRYDGTLSPCDVTSCSGAPKWRGSWQNTLDFGRFKTSLTSYYTSGYDLASTDYGGAPGECATTNIGASVVTYDDGTPILCRGKSFMTHDLTMALDVGDHFTLYANVLNLLDTKAPYDPSAAYGIYNYNVAWAQSGF